MTRRLPLACLSMFLTLTAALPPAVGADSSLTPYYSQMQWRLVGPFRGGWSTMAEGVPGQPNTFYFGGADGGLWKTVDAGLTWEPLFQQEDSISVGALAVAPSNPDILYIGTGQPETRYDIVEGTGIYRSADGGKTWAAVGLKDTWHIGRIWVDPTNPDVVVVAALGHMFGPNEERGVFRSEDGGQHWDKTLFVDKNTGAVDLAADPAEPQTMYAASWQIYELPWLSYYLPAAAPGSGIWKSSDEGKTWARLNGHGLPAGNLGRIGLAVAPGTHGQRVYALIETQDDADGGLYRSDDGGMNWTKEGGEELPSSYFGRLVVDPKNADTVYAVNRSVARSTDGGKTFNWFKGAPGGDDYHFMWINPDDDRYMILASDQGTTVSVDGGKSWSQWYNQPTGQFYHVVTDSRFPYRIYSGQQDSGTVETESASDYGEISFREWQPVGGDERSYVIPDNGDPNIVYVGGLGGHVSRYDARTGQVQAISPMPFAGVYGRRPTTVKYHFNWFYPVVADPHRAHVLYVGSQVIFKTEDEGMHWKVISPDLTRNGTKQGGVCDADPISLTDARDCGFGSVFSIAPSPLNGKLVWAGTDDGFVQLTPDGGAHWKDVTPKDMPLWGRVNQVEASPVDAASAYVAVDTHRQDKFAPYIYRTHDYGRTWTLITQGIPADQYVYVVRQDPVNGKLLYAGTNAGVYVSFDDGDLWQPLQLNLPTARVRDLTVHGGDLVAATQGRALWVLDDVTPLRQAAAVPAGAAVYLFKPAEAVRVRSNENKDTPLPAEVPAGENPPTGAVIDYWLAPETQGPVSLAIYDAKGKLVRRFDSDAKLAALKTEQYFTDNWLAPVEALPGGAGAHRFVWNLRYPRPPSLSYDYSIAASPTQGGDVLPEGPLALPGQYRVELTVGGKSSSEPLTVKPDPRDPKTDVAKALSEQFAFELELGKSMQASYDGFQELQKLSDEVKTLKTGLDVAKDADIIQAADALAAKAVELQSKAKDHRNFRAIDGQFTNLVTEAEDGDRAPPAQYREVYDIYVGYLKDVQNGLDGLKKGELAKLNALLTAKGKPPLS